MRIPKYLSPTALAKYEKDKEQYYIEYLSDTRRPRDPQTQAMSVGGAFDAYVKAYLAESVFGKDGAASRKLSFEEVFESQIEAHNRDLARVDGLYCFEQYRKFGALSALLREMSKSRIEPELDLKIDMRIYGTMPWPSGDSAILPAPAASDIVTGVPIHGRPDLHFVTHEGIRVILDWKVNGFYSKALPSPAKGYIRCWRPHCEGSYETHKDFLPGRIGDMDINRFYTLDSVKEDWASQLATYSWVLDGRICIECPTVFWIEQLLLTSRLELRTKERIVQHRCAIPAGFQLALYARYKALWAQIMAGYPCLSEARKAELDPAWDAMIAPRSVGRER